MLYVTNTGHMKTQRRFWYMMNFFAYIFVLHSWYLRAVITSKGSGLADLWKKIWNTKNRFEFAQDNLLKKTKFQLDF